MAGVNACTNGPLCSHIYGNTYVSKFSRAEVKGSRQGTSMHERCKHVGPDRTREVERRYWSGLLFIVDNAVQMGRSQSYNE